MEQIATPVGHIVVLIVGYVLAVGLGLNRDTIYLLFYRLSGGSARVGRLAALAAPVVVFAGALLIVFCSL